MVGTGAGVDGTEHTEVVWIDIGLVAGAEGSIVRLFRRRGASEWLVAGWTFGETANLKTMRRRVSDHNGIVMPAAVVGEHHLQERR